MKHFKTVTVPKAQGFMHMGGQGGLTFEQMSTVLDRMFAFMLGLVTVKNKGEEETS